MKIDATIEDLALINQYTRRELDKDEVYIFSFVLCDNEIDEDFDKFTDEALLQLSELFKGKSGIIESQNKTYTVRIISCAVKKVKGRKTKSGDTYQQIIAKAYIINNDDNKTIISLLSNKDTLKQATVACSVRSKLCSVCGEKNCTHIKGKYYNKKSLKHRKLNIGKLCYSKLFNVNDAYEFIIAI